MTPFDPFISGYYNPISRANVWQPINIFGAAAKMTIVLLDSRSTALRDRIGDTLTRKIRIRKKC